MGDDQEEDPEKTVKLSARGYGEYGNLRPN
jgi:hypothetical protein